MATFPPFAPNGSEDIRHYLARFSAFISTKDVVKPLTPPPLAEGAAEDVVTAHAVSVADHATALARYYICRKRWLIAVMGKDTYAVLDGLCGEQTPEDKTCNVSEALMRARFRPARNKNDMRAKFTKRVQQQGERVAHFADALRDLVQYCEYGTFLDQALQTQFINNIPSDKIQDKIIEGAADFQLQVERAERYEAFYSKQPAQGEPVHWVGKTGKPRPQRKQFSKPNPPEGIPKHFSIQTASTATSCW